MKHKLLAFMLVVALVLLTGCASPSLAGDWSTADGSLRATITDDGWMSCTFTQDGESYHFVYQWHLSGGVLTLNTPHDESSHRSMTCFFSGNTLVLGGYRLQKVEE